MRYEKHLERIYNDPTHPASFSSPFKLWSSVRKKFPKLKLSSVQEWLQSQNSYTLHRKIVRKFPRRKTIVAGVGIQFQADLIDISPIKRENNGTRYLLTVIDCFSRKAVAIPMKKKTQENSINAFKKAFKILGYPQKLQTDQGSEFIAGSVRKYLEEKRIKWFFTHTTLKSKASIVERFNRTLWEKIIKYLVSKETLNYISALPDILEGYNNSVHSSIKPYTPAQVSKKNEGKVFEVQYRKYLDTKKKKKNLLKIGDVVRLAISTKGAFRKGHHRNFSVELYEIIDVKKTIPTTYVLKDMESSTPVLGISYRQQLQKVRTQTREIGKRVATHKVFGQRAKKYS